MLGFTERCVETISLFGVVKKYAEGENGQMVRSVRPVWDQRRANMRWHAPPSVLLVSPANFCHLDLSTLAEGERIVSGTGDIPDMFSRLATSACCWPWFVLEGLRAGDLHDYFR